MPRAQDSPIIISCPKTSPVRRIENIKIQSDAFCPESTRAFLKEKRELQDLTWTEGLQITEMFSHRKRGNKMISVEAEHCYKRGALLPWGKLSM